MPFTFYIRAIKDIQFDKLLLLDFVMQKIATLLLKRFL